MGGHPFSLRNAHSAYAEGSITGPQEGPVFLCFLDCIYQVLETNCLTDIFRLCNNSLIHLNLEKNC